MGKISLIEDIKFQVWTWLHDENPKTGQIQGPMTRSKTKQSVDTLQQMVADILNKAQVEKDEGPKAEALQSILIVAEGPCQICSIFLLTQNLTFSN